MPERHRVLVIGATGFIGSALVPELLSAGHFVRAAARRIHATRPHPNLEWAACDLLTRGTLLPVLDGVESAYYLAHSLGRPDFGALDRRAARTFAAAAAASGLRRIVYLGGVAPAGPPSEHLASRVEVGEILRGGQVPTIELRASMIVGNGSASWQIVRDLAFRLPAMVLPRWLRSRTRPIALSDAVRALVDALDVPLPHSEWFDIPGPETLSGKQILERIAALRGSRILSVSVPLLTPKLSALWLRLVTSADYGLAREIVIGLRNDLLPRDERYWELTGHPARVRFEEAARLALGDEAQPRNLREQAIRLEESLARRLSPSRG